MSQLDQLLDAASRFAANFEETVDVASLSISPRRGIVMITCVDPRVDPTHLFGLEVGDAIVARTPGGRVSTELLDDLHTAGAVGARKPDIKRTVTDLLVIHHTACGFTAIADDDLRAEICAEIGGDAERMAGLAIGSFEESLATDVDLVRADERYPDTLTVTGWLYDVATGGLEMVVGPS